MSQGGCTLAGSSRTYLNPILVSGGAGCDFPSFDLISAKSAQCSLRGQSLHLNGFWKESHGSWACVHEHCEPQHVLRVIKAMQDTRPGSATIATHGLPPQVVTSIFTTLHSIRLTQVFAYSKRLRNPS